MELKTGTLLKHGEYRIEKVLGQGGFGITYLACQVSLDRKVAVKEFFMKDLCNRDDNTSLVSVPSVGSRKTVESFRHKFIKEARLIASFNNGNIIHIHDVFEDNGTAYYVMEYIDGKNLSSIVAERGALDEATAVRYVRQVSNALADIHNRNLLHLDVKPANIMLNAQGDVVLIDFGASKHYDSAGSQTSSTPLCLSEGYAPLEQYEAGALRSFTSATDIYALGATLFTLVSGVRPPRAGDVMNEGLPVLPSEISPTVRAAIEAAMQPRRKDRPQSIAEFLDLLKDSKHPKDLNEETRIVKKETEQPTVKSSEPAIPNKNRTSLVVVVIALFGILIGGGLFFAFSGGDSNNGSNNSGNDRLAAHSEEPATTVVIEDTEEEKPTVPTPSVVNTDSIVAARMQAYQDSIDAANATREEAARLEREEQVRREREEAERLAREQQQGISTQKKVDLGLSVCWAGWNVDASSPEGYGNYYAWGETTTKSNYTQSSYQYFDGSNYVNIGSNISGTQYDVARAQWGGSWRMPTKAEFQELKERCTWTWTTYNNVNGYKVTGPNGNSIFLPAVGCRLSTKLDYRGSQGYYWSGSLYEGYQSNAYVLSFHSGGRLVDYKWREYGRTVRPVCNK